MSGGGKHDGYLKPFLERTPFASVLLNAAWDGLSTETQIKVLHVLGGAVPEEAGRKAAKSPNEYVRYLAAKAGFKNADEQSALVQSADASTPPRPDAAPFAHLPYERQLALLRGSNAPGEEEFISIVTSASTVMDDARLALLVEEYCRELAGRYGEEGNAAGYRWQGGGTQGIEQLWRFMAALPPARAALRHAFIAGLPVQRGSGLLEETVAPEDVLSGLPEDEMTRLLHRRDVGLGILRERIFLSAESAPGLRHAAAAHNMRISDSAFGRLLREKSPLLEELARVYAGRLVFLEALKDHFASLADFANADAAGETLMREIAEKRGDFHDIRNLKIYRLAKEIVPWGSNETKMDYLPLSMGHLSTAVVKGDTWATFRNLKAGIGYNLRFEKALPSIRELETASIVPEPPEKPEDLFQKNYPDGVFLEEKINFIGRKLIESRNEPLQNTSAAGKTGKIAAIAVLVALLALAFSLMR